MKQTITLALMLGAMMTCLVACSDDEPKNPTNPKGVGLLHRILLAIQKSVAMRLCS